jgi:hypothetical protein
MADVDSKLVAWLEKPRWVLRDTNSTWCSSDDDSSGSKCMSLWLCE